MVDIERLDAFLMSDDAPENCMQISDLDGFLTGIVCSPDLIQPSEWFPIVWNTSDPDLTKEGVWAAREILFFHNQIAQGLNNDPPDIDPVLVEREDGTLDASEWCKGFARTLDIRDDQWEQWRDLLETTQGRDWLFPIVAHLDNDKGKSLVGISSNDRGDVLDVALEQIYQTIPKIFEFWRSTRSPHE